MASTLLHFLSQPNSAFLNHLSSIPNQTSNNPSKLFLHSFNKAHFTIKCTTSSSNSTSPEPEKEPEFEDFPSPPPSSMATIKPESFPIERRRKSEILRERRPGTGLVKPEPPNFEVGWKRTKPINLEKPVGYVIMDFLEKLQELMDRQFGSTELLAKTGEIVAVRAIEEAEVLRDEGKVEERMVIELSRVLRLMEMDLAMVKAEGFLDEEAKNEWRFLLSLFSVLYNRIVTLSMRKSKMGGNFLSILFEFCTI